MVFCGLCEVCRSYEYSIHGMCMKSIDLKLVSLRRQAATVNDEAHLRQVTRSG